MGTAALTGNVSVTATTEGTATTVATVPAVDCPTGPLLCELFCPQIQNTGATNTRAALFVDGTSQGTVLNIDLPTSSGFPVNLRTPITVASGSHTFSYRVWMPSGAGVLRAGTGGSGANRPGEMRVIHDV